MAPSKAPKVIAILGPTASGKTDLAMNLVERIEGEIISVDSALIYRGMDIGSAKPTAEELARAPHRLVDICDPAQAYSAADFARDAEQAIQEILSEGRTPVLCGGTMLYFRALFQGLSPMPASDAQVRADVEAEAKLRGWPALHADLAQIDPECAARLHPNHSQRIGRALEVYRISGKNMTYWQSLPGDGLLERLCVEQIALIPQQREVLHQRIAARFDKMLKLGFIDEVKALFARSDLNPEMPSIRAVGYRQVWEYLAGQHSYEEMRQKGIAATRQLAKRQLTWLRSWPEAKVLNTLDESGCAIAQDEILTRALNILEQRPL